jgi:hypothetical protein
MESVPLTHIHLMPGILSTLTLSLFILLKLLRCGIKIIINKCLIHDLPGSGVETRDWPSPAVPSNG